MYVQNSNKQQMTESEIGIMIRLVTDVSKRLPLFKVRRRFEKYQENHELNGARSSNVVKQ
jgi:hypothetical protein